MVSRTRLRVRYADTDQMGVVYYANYLVWFEVGRTEWLRDAGWSYREMEDAGVRLPVIEAACEYRQPLRYDDEVEIRTQATAMSPVRVRFDYEVVQLPADVVVADGRTVHAAIGPHGRPCRLPSRVRDLLNEPRAASPARKGHPSSVETGRSAGQTGRAVSTIQRS